MQYVGTYLKFVGSTVDLQPSGDTCRLGVGRYLTYLLQAQQVQIAVRAGNV